MNDFMRNFLAVPFGFLIYLFYEMSGNYILSIFLLTLLVKLILLPTSISQQKAQAKSARIQPKLRKIQEKYAGNQVKIGEETQALYQREGYSPMSGGCLPMLIQFPIMIGLYQVNYTPFSNVLRLPKGIVEALTAAAQQFVVEGDKRAAYQMELYALKHFNELDLTKIPDLTADMIERIQTFISGYNFLGLDLSVTPNYKEFNIYWLIPIVSGIFALAMGVYSYLRQRKTSPEMAKNPAMGCTMLLSPAMQIYFAFLFPTSVGVYIIMSSALSFVQMVLLNHFYSPKKVTAKMMVAETVERRAKEINTKKIAEMQDNKFDSED